MEQQGYRGEQLGLPESGPASLAPVGPRLGAFLADTLICALLAGLVVRAITRQPLPGTWSMIPFAVDYLAGPLIFGRTLGMYLFGLRLIRVDTDAAVGPGRAVLRLVLLSLLVPALVFDRDNRGLHDRLTDTAVVRA